MWGEKWKRIGIRETKEKGKMLLYKILKNMMKRKSKLKELCVEL
jgi:hypothetical protein